MACRLNGAKPLSEPAFAKSKTTELYQSIWVET